MKLKRVRILAPVSLKGHVHGELLRPSPRTPGTTARCAARRSTCGRQLWLTCWF